MSRVRIGSVVVDCNDLPTMMAFWRGALGYVPREEPEEGWVVLIDAEGRAVNVSLQRVPEPRVGKNRLHFDLYTTDPGAEIERLVGLGARIHERPADPDADFVVLEDPEDNLFCVVDKSHPGSFNHLRKRLE